MNRMQRTILAGVLTIGSFSGIAAAPAQAQQPARPTSPRPGYSIAYQANPDIATPRSRPAGLAAVVRPSPGYHVARRHLNSAERYRDWTTGRSNSSLLSKPWLRPLD